MDASLIHQLIDRNQPFRIETAAGRVFEVPHRDFISFTARKTAVIISFLKNGEQSFEIVPLLTITSAGALGELSNGAPK